MPPTEFCSRCHSIASICLAECLRLRLQGMQFIYFLQLPSLPTFSRRSPISMWVIFTPSLRPVPDLVGALRLLARAVKVNGNKMIFGEVQSEVL